MPNSLSKPSIPEPVRAEFQALHGVRRVVIDAESGAALVICDSQARPSLEGRVRDILVREGIPQDAVELIFTPATHRDVQRRVRFDGVRLERPRANFSVATVALEWKEQRYEGRSEGEGGAPQELRVCADATIDALHKVLEDEVAFQLVGVKAIRVFDDELVAVLLYSPQAADRRLVGVALADDPHRAASVAVLNATNRMLGNYLVAE